MWALVPFLNTVYYRSIYTHLAYDVIGLAYCLNRKVGLFGCVFACAWPWFKYTQTNSYNYIIVGLWGLNLLGVGSAYACASIFGVLLH